MFVKNLLLVLLLVILTFTSVFLAPNPPNFHRPWEGTSRSASGSGSNSRAPILASTLSTPPKPFSSAIASSSGSASTSWNQRAPSSSAQKNDYYKKLQDQQELNKKIREKVFSRNGIVKINKYENIPYPVINYECQRCRKSFALKDQLLNHIKNHK